MKNLVITPPTNLIQYRTTKHSKIWFVGGSIENGLAEDWQPKLVTDVGDTDSLVLNPRRSDWNSSWTQTIENPLFAEQVTWELTGLEIADVVTIYFDKNTKSAISLLELGLYAKSGKLLVYCPSGFWRKGNVDIVGRLYGFPVFDDYDSFVQAIRLKLLIK
jgi:hypothetical protein